MLEIHNHKKKKHFFHDDLPVTQRAATKDGFETLYHNAILT
jgi:hypothetical protein